MGKNQEPERDKRTPHANGDRRSDRKPDHKSGKGDEGEKHPSKKENPEKKDQ
ncbi:MAG: hypothetical protein H6581_05940 [Bacteroidia bacterium]|nr:hypothetical protein [Bacteroidia bacterium]